jgi:hypothetical protein
MGALPPVPPALLSPASQAATKLTKKARQTVDGYAKQTFIEKSLPRRLLPHREVRSLASPSS